MANRDELLEIFEIAGAIRHGHFELSSGLHSGMYVQCALALQYPRFAEKLGAALAARFVDARIEAVVSPALGGLIVGEEGAPALPDTAGGGGGGGGPAIFWERGGRGPRGAGGGVLAGPRPRGAGGERSLGTPGVEP